MIVIVYFEDARVLSGASIVRPQFATFAHISFFLFVMVIILFDVLYYVFMLHISLWVIFKEIRAKYDEYTSKQKHTVSHRSCTLCAEVRYTPEYTVNYLNEYYIIICTYVTNLTEYSFQIL